ncbi:penicillin-binding transpeptidase domain-containing protein [Nonomuraea sp. NPDC048916]|uniref:peptidoglycan D,D-transpeptidase FtsI family protein n=1 Tax=Nonomuraea sp. NPDC048916 TaxID=3154232 RepID=UPI0033D89CEE
MNIPLRRVALVCGAMFFSLLANITYVQTVGARGLYADPRNERALLARFGHPRGDILTYEGRTIVRSRESRRGPYEYRRVYTDGEMYAPVTGYVSLHQAAGIEQAENGVLSGDDPGMRMRRLVRDGEVDGADVRLTIRQRVQWAAYQSLRSAGLPGAAVAIDPATGAILALASYPSYDPNAYSTLNPDRLARVDHDLSLDPGRPLLNRALERSYPPGSAFTVVTAATALASGEYTPESRLSGPARLPLPGRPDHLSNPGGRPCGDGTPSLARAFRRSCDTAFADLGLRLGQDSLRDQAEAFGFGAGDLAIPLRVVPSTLPRELDRAGTALTAAGRHLERATPLVIAMLSAAVANDGVMMRPYLVQDVRLPDGSIINRGDATPYRTTLAAPLARQLASMMTAVTRPGGTGTAAAIAGVEVAAGGTPAAFSGIRPATGAGPRDHAVFTAFAPADAPEVAVGVVLEHAPPGDSAAIPIARAVLQAALS